MTNCTEIVLFNAKEVVVEAVLLVGAVVLVVTWLLLSLGMTKKVGEINKRIEHIAEKRVNKILKKRVVNREVERDVDRQIDRLHRDEIDPERNMRGVTVSNAASIAGMLITVVKMIYETIKAALGTDGTMEVAVLIVVANVLLVTLTRYAGNKAKNLDEKVVRRKICSAMEKWLAG